MATRYATLNTKITEAVRQHLLTIDALPPRSKVTQLAQDLAEIVLAELKNSGLTQATLEQVLTQTPATATAKAGQ